MSHRKRIKRTGTDSFGHNGRPYQPDQPIVTVRSLKAARGERDGSINRKIGNRVARRRGFANYRALIADVARGLMRSSGMDPLTAVHIAATQFAGVKR